MKRSPAFPALRLRTHHIARFQTKSDSCHILLLESDVILIGVHAHDVRYGFFHPYSFGEWVFASRLRVQIHLHCALQSWPHFLPGQAVVTEKITYHKSKQTNPLKYINKWKIHKFDQILLF